MNVAQNNGLHKWKEFVSTRHAFKYHLMLTIAHLIQIIDTWW